MGLKDYIQKKKASFEAGRERREQQRAEREERETKRLFAEAKRAEAQLKVYKAKDAATNKIKAYKAEKFKRSGFGKFVSGMDNFSSGFESTVGGSKSRDMFAISGLGGGGNAFGGGDLFGSPERSKPKAKKRKKSTSKKSSSGRSITIKL